MALLEIVRLGHPSLRTPAAEVDLESIQTPAMQQFFRDMKETMREANGVGLAGSQVAVNSQIFVWDRDPEAEESEVGLVINPSVELHPGEMVYDWEGCLSIPDLHGLVPRYPHVTLYGLNEQGERFEEELTDFVARIVQHEYDHLHGVIFLDRMRDMQSLSFAEELNAYLAGEDHSTVG